MIKDIKELNFPAYATLETATATIADMGDRTITSQVKIDGDVVPDFSYDWEVEFKGERYIHPVKTPQGTKDNSSRKAKIDLVFQHWAIYEMKRQYFVEMASTAAGTAIADKYIASLGLNLGDFVTAFNLVLNHYFGGRIIIKLNPEWQYDAEAQFVSISYSYIWDVLQQMHEIYGVRWTLKTNAEGVCEILMGYPAEDVSHIFEYGFEGGLLSVQRQVQSTEIRNRLLGRGGSKNLPHRYFKDKDPNNPIFEADPDWIPELANITFTELRGKTFRDYVRGWKAKRYGGTSMDEPTEAYLAGYNAEKFDPIEYVDDKESIEKYGVHVGALKNNEEIYPSIQGAPGDVDMIVDAEQVTDDDVDAAIENDAVETNVDGMSYTRTGVKTGEEVSINVSARNAKVYFSVPEGKKGTINEPSYTAKGKYQNYSPSTGRGGGYVDVPDGLITVYRDKCSFTVHKKSTGEQVSRLNIPPGEYYYEAKVVASHAYTGDINLTASVSAIHLITSTDTDSGWHQTFDIWVRNIWGSERNAGETDQQYADRVWLPILGDRMSNEARVVFASGWLSFSSDWEFPIVGYAFDDSKTGSHWRLTLAKIDAEKDAGRPFIPYEGYNASAGDRFFFIGIDMPHQYVLWGEERVDDDKRDSLLQTAKINPAWVIKTDKVRLNQNREGAKLIDSLSAGAQIRLASKQFISGAYESLYVQSMTYNWNSDTILYPDVEVVVSDKVHTVKNPVAQMQGSIDTLQRQVGSLSNIQQIIRQVCDQLYLRKDGIEDLSKSPTRFLGKVTGEKFRQGQIGGRDWGIYRDENGNAILETDKIVARQGILVSDLVVNEATYVGGLQINSAASMKITEVEDTEAGYVCYFDQQQGSVTNKFKIDDVVLCQKFDPEDNEIHFYKRRVIAVAETSVTLSKTDVSGAGIPSADDEIIHYGNYTDKTRQFVIIRDVIGGGYERMLMGLDSVTSDGFEYYFAGKSADSQARWFVGDSKQYAKYENGQITIKGNLLVTGSDKPITDQIAELDYIKDAFGDGAQGLILGTAIIVGYNNDQGDFVPMAGMSGVFDKDSENGGPAAWYGGTVENAKSMIFMDGTGYFAGGMFKWDRDNGVNLGNDAIKINYDGSVDFGGNIRIGSTGEETLDSLLTIVAQLTDIWKLDKETSSIYTDYEVIVKNNLAVHGDTSTSGGGEPSTVLVSGIRLNGKIYRDTNEDGVIDLGTIEAGGLDEAELSEYLTANGYATQDWVSLQNYITASALAPYATKTALSALQSSHDTLKAEFDALSAVLSDDVSGKINTWNEIVDFLDEYSGSEDLATILSGMNTDIAKRALQSDLTALTTRLGTAEGNITSLTNGKADKATTLAGYGITDAFTKDEVTTKLDSYLLKSGNETHTGTLTLDGQGIIPLVVTHSTKDSNVYARYDGGGTVLGYLGFETLSKPSFMAYNGEKHELWHRGNLTKLSQLTDDVVSGKYLPLTGGTISEMLELNTSETSEAGIKLSMNGSSKGWLGYTEDIGYGTCLYNYACDKYVGIKDDGTPHYNGNTLLHSGNYSDYTLRLSGNQYYRFADSSGETGVLTQDTSQNNTWYIVGKTGDYNTLLHSGNVGGYALQYYGTNMPADIVNYVGYGKIETGWKEYGPAITFGLSSYYTQIQRRLNTDEYLVRGYDAGTYTDWKTIAFTNSNVASATKLATARNIWGQSFDGTGNVSGNIHLGNGGDFEIGTGYSSENTSRYNRITIGSDNMGIKYLSGGWTSGNVIAHDFKVGMDSTSALMVNNVGNVTIGGSDLAGTDAKLYVDGVAKFKSITQAESISDYDNRTGYFVGKRNAGLGVTTGGLLLFAYGTTPISFHAGGAERMHITAGGNVGIGTTDPQAKLDVVGGQVRVMAGASGTTYQKHHGFITGFHGIDVMEFYEAEFRFYGNAGESNCSFSVHGNSQFHGATAVSGTLTSNTEIVVANGATIAFLDASGNKHTMRWDDDNNGIRIDTNLVLDGDLATAQI